MSSGGPTIRRNPGLEARVRGAVSRNLLNLFCDVMVRTAKQLSPLKTGNNQRSIYSKQISELTFEVGTASNYGAYLELGTSRMPARPYMAPGADAGRAKLESTSPRDWE